MCFEMDRFIDNETIILLLDEKNYHSIYNLLISNKILEPSFGLIHLVEYNCNKKVISAKFLFDNFGLKSIITDKYIINNFDEYVFFVKKKLMKFTVII